MNNDYLTLFKHILELSKKEAELLCSHVITCEHLLLASFKQKEGFVFRILSQLNLPINQIIDELEEHSRSHPYTEEATTIFNNQ